MINTPRQTAPRWTREKWIQAHKSTLQFKWKTNTLKGLTPEENTFSNILIKRKEEHSKIKLKTVCKLAKITGRHCLISQDVRALVHQNKNIKREYYKLKRASRTIIAT